MRKHYILIGGYLAVCVSYDNAPFILDELLYMTNINDGFAAQIGERIVPENAVWKEFIRKYGKALEIRCRIERIYPYPYHCDPDSQTTASPVQ